MLSQMQTKIVEPQFLLGKEMAILETVRDSFYGD